MKKIIDTFSNIPDDIDTINDIAHTCQFHLTNTDLHTETSYPSISFIRDDNEAVFDAFFDGEDIHENFVRIISTLIALDVDFTIELNISPK